MDADEFDDVDDSSVSVWSLRKYLIWDESPARGARDAGERQGKIQNFGGTGCRGGIRRRMKNKRTKKMVCRRG